jgi:two-component system response regulator YesN
MLKAYLIDDEELIVRELETLIDWQKQGYEICGSSTDPLQAKKDILALKPTIVISDVNMDGLDGLTLANQVSGFLPDTSFCFLSAYDKFDYALGALKVGAVDYLTKPIKPEKLIAVLEKTKNELNETFSKNVFASLVDEGNNKSNDYLRRVFENYPLFPKNEAARIVCFYGRNDAIPNLHEEGGFSKCLYRDEVMYASIVFSPRIDVLKNDVEKYHVSVGVSPEFTNYLEVDKFIRMARLASKEKFITGANTFAEYHTNENATKLINEINASRNEYELKANVATLEEKIKQYGIPSYSLQKVYRIILFNMMKFGLMDYDEEASEVSVVDFYDNLHDFVDDLMGNFETPTTTSEDVSGALMGEVIRDMEDNIQEKRTLSYYAKKYSYNACYFSQLFKKVNGESFATYFINLKIAKAKNLLATTNIPLSDVALKVGYDDYCHFSKLFKKYTSLSPSEFRDSLVEADVTHP